MKLWVDDMRTPPDDGWEWAATSDEAIVYLNDRSVHTLSLDHDLGGDDTTRPIVLHMCMEEIWPRVILIHSCNPVGIQWLLGMCRRYAPTETTVHRGPAW